MTSNPLARSRRNTCLTSLHTKSPLRSRPAVTCMIRMWPTLGGADGSIAHEVDLSPVWQRPRAHTVGRCAIEHLRVLGLASGLFEGRQDPWQVLLAMFNQTAPSRSGLLFGCEAQALLCW